MRASIDSVNAAPPDTRSPGASRVAVAGLAAAFMLIGGCAVPQGEPAGPVEKGVPTVGVEPEAPGSTVGDSTTSSSSTTTTTSLPPPEDPPAVGARYVVPPTEAEPEAKQLATDIAYSLTTYEASDDHQARLEALGSRSGAEALAEASAPLTYTGSWSRGEVIYPQLGGLRNGRTSVMVVTRQTVGSGPETEFSLVRTLDIRLVLVDSAWEFDFLSSAGGTFDQLDDLALAHAVAADPRIEMPDSAHLDIHSGLVSTTLLEVMAELAEQTPFGVVTFSTGHPRHVFETDRLSHHTIGQAVDIHRIGDRLVIDDRDPGSSTHAIAEWLYDHPDVRQVGSPWDLDGAGSKRSFTDEVHQDHIHLAVDDGG